MDCRKISDLINKYLDNELNDTESELLHSHMSECPECKLEFTLLKAAILSVEELPEIEMQVGFEKRVMASIKTQKTQKASWNSLFLGAGAFGLIVFICYIGLFVTLPQMVGSGAMDMILTYVYSTFAFAIKNLVDGFVEVVLYFGKLLTLRDILMNQSFGIVVMALGIAIFNLGILKSIRVQQE